MHDRGSLGEPGDEVKVHSHVCTDTLRLSGHPFTVLLHVLYSSQKALTHPPMNSSQKAHLNNTHTHTHVDMGESLGNQVAEHSAFFMQMMMVMMMTIAIVRVFCTRAIQGVCRPKKGMFPRV